MNPQSGRCSQFKLTRRVLAERTGVSGQRMAAVESFVSDRVDRRSLLLPIFRDFVEHRVLFRTLSIRIQPFLFLGLGFLAASLGGYTGEPGSLSCLSTTRIFGWAGLADDVSSHGAAARAVCPVEVADQEPLGTTSMQPPAPIMKTILARLLGPGGATPGRASGAKRLEPTFCGCEAPRGKGSPSLGVYS
jgi:hypothetical protein